MKKEIFYATSNPGKFDEVNRYLKIHAPEIILKQYKEDLFEPQITDAHEIAVMKAKQAFKFLQKPILVDDAGIYLKCFNNFPGTITKFIIKGIGYEGIFSLLKENTDAYFLLYMVYIDESNLESFEGRCEGKIIRPEKFEAPLGLPWDAIFSPNGTNKTYTEIRNTPDEQKYAYRIFALQKFLNWYKKNKA